MHEGPGTEVVERRLSGRGAVTIGFASRLIKLVGIDAYELGRRHRLARGHKEYAIAVFEFRAPIGAHHEGPRQHVATEN